MIPGQALDRELVARRAYAIWQREGCPEGCAWQHWFRAEQELSVENGDRPALDPYTFDVPSNPQAKAEAPAAAH